MKIITNKEHKRLVGREEVLRGLRSDLSILGPLDTFDKLVKKYNEVLSYEQTLSELSEFCDKEDGHYKSCLGEAKLAKKEYNKLIMSLKM